MDVVMGNGNRVIAKESAVGNLHQDQKTPSPVPAGRWKCEVFLRVLGFVFTLVAAIVVGVDKQSKIVPFQLNQGLPTLDLRVVAKWNYLSAFLYFVVANAITCFYSFGSLFIVLKNKNRNNTLVLLVIILDIIMVALLFSGGGAAAAVGIIGYNGNSHVQWNKVCNVFGKFCNQATVAIVISFVGAFAFMVLVIMGAVGLLKRSS